MFSTVIKAAVYTGFVYNILGMVVCFMFGEMDLVMKKLAGLTLWIVVHFMHKKLGTY